MSITSSENILIPIDFSPDSDAAVREGFKLAKLMKAGVTLLHVIHDPLENPGFYQKMDSEGELDAEEEESDDEVIADKENRGQDEEDLEQEVSPSSSKHKPIHIDDAAKEKMDAYVKKRSLEKKASKAGIKFRTRLRHGLPVDQIVRISKKDKYGLIVIGGSGKSGLASVLMGSVTEKVVKRSAVPVLVVKKSQT